jgi:RimJ/RimL family protein N-acetyltransferase
MLTHAFDALGAARVVWHTDIYNERSQAAIGRLGATREGELRKHRIRRDGSWRTTVQYSMTDDDWPVARHFLTDRLGRA